MHQADYTNTGSEPCRQVLSENAHHYQMHDTLLLGVLRYRFNYIDSNAVRNGQLRWDTSVPSRLFDVAGRRGSPYILREVAVAAVLADSTRSGTVNFRLDPASIFSNVGSSLTSASIDFGDGGGSRILVPSQVLQVNYTAVGRKIIRYVLRYADGSLFTTYSSLYVSNIVGCANCRTTAPEPIAACRVEQLTADIQFQGSAGQAEVSYYYSTNGTKICDNKNNTSQSITKPIVIIDGIDYEDSRKGGDIYGENLYYISKGQEFNLGDELRKAGYDVVILDFPNIEKNIKIGPFNYKIVARRSGADYMERNAFTLVTLLQQLNQRMQAVGSTEKIVVIGPSMGGQVARYALAYMEKNNLAHNTRLFISLDSPHNGANIPLGLQHFIDYFAGATKDATSVAALDKINSPAARELVQHHYSQGTAFAPHPYRTQFLSDLNSFGNYPSQLRRVAVTNGALDGVGQVDQNGRPLLAGQQAFGMEQRGVPKGGLTGTGVRAFPLLGLIARLITVASARVYYGPGFGQTQTVLESYYITKGRHTQQATGPGNSCGLDAAPGGYRDFFSELSQQNSSGLFQLRNFYSVRDRTCFIPTLSALGYLPASANSCQPVGQTLVCAGTTPFDAYYGPTGHNEDHIQLTPGNVEFIRNEVLLKTPTPVFSVAPTELCIDGGSVSYSVLTECVSSRPGVAPLATSYTWATGAGLRLVSGQGQATVQLQPLAGFSGTSTVQVVARRTGYTDSAPLVLQVRVSNGEVQLTGPSGPECVYSSLSYAISTSTLIQPVVDWHVYLDNVAHDEFIQDQQVASLVVQPTSPGTLQVVATYTTTCTPSRRVDATVYTTVASQLRNPDGSYSPCAQYRMAAPKSPPAYPNPANASLTVPALATPVVAAEQTVILYNVQGQEVRRATADGSTELMTADLPTGLYFLVTQRNGVISRSHVQIKH